MSQRLESFRFEDEDDIQFFNFLAYSLKVDTLESFILFFFTTKVSTLISVEGSEARFRSLTTTFLLKLVVE